MTTQPANSYEQNGITPHLVLAPTYKDPITGALYVHSEYVMAATPWEAEAHISPMSAAESFGDVESFVAYVQKHGKESSFLTWNAKGLHAVIDYTERNQWKASCPFVPTPEFRDWAAFANGHAIPLAKAVEFIDDHANHIHEPDQATLLDILRKLRANVTATAETELRPDGTSSVRFTKNSTVQAGEAVLPPEITIQIPVLKGHVDAAGALVVYKLVLKLRVSPDNDARLSLRLNMPAQERVLEEVYAERVAAAKALLGDEYTILRAAD